MRMSSSPTLVAHQSLSICELKPCSFDGVYQPSLLDAFSNGKVLLLSYFYDRIHPLIPEDKDKVTVSSIKDLASTVCMGRSAWLDRWGTQPDVRLHPSSFVQPRLLHPSRS